jgi:hypothetical protein
MLQKASMPASSVAEAPSSRSPAADALVRRLTLAAVLAAVAAAVYAATTPLSTAAAMESELMRLLRGMVLIKAAMALAAIAFVFWRIAQPLERGRMTGYSVGAAMLVASVVWLWSLYAIPLAAGLFYGGLIWLAAVARGDALFYEALRRRFARR